MPDTPRAASETCVWTEEITQEDGGGTLTVTRAACRPNSQFPRRRGETCGNCTRPIEVKRREETDG